MLTICPFAVTRGGGGCVGGGGITVKGPSLKTCLVLGFASSLAVTCTLCLPESTSSNTCPEVPE